MVCSLNYLTEGRMERCSRMKRVGQMNRELVCLERVCDKWMRWSVSSGQKSRFIQ